MTQWGSGNFAPQWLEIDLGTPTDISEIALLVAQYPEGNTTHQVWGRGPGESYQLLIEFSGYTRGGDWLVYTPTTPWQGVQFVRIETIASPSWVSWKEICLFGVDKFISSKHVGVSYMTFWGVTDFGSWSLPRIFTPILGLYSSPDPQTAEAHITTAMEYGINLFLLDFGWVQPGDQIDLAAQSGLLQAENVDLINVCIFYFPDAVVGQDWSQGPDRLMADFDYVAQTYFTHPSYLRVNNRPLVIVNDLPVYWSEPGVSETNALFAELKEHISTNYSLDLYLIGGVWHDSEVEFLQGNPFDGLTVWGNLWSSLGNDPDRTYDYSEYSNAYRSIWARWHDVAVANTLEFVPMVMPGFDNLAYETSGDDQYRYVIERDLNEFASLSRYANNLTTDNLNMLLFFTWNDFNESTSIEPSNEYGSSYLEAARSSTGTPTITPTSTATATPQLPIRSISHCCGRAVGDRGCHDENSRPGRAPPGCR